MASSLFHEVRSRILADNLRTALGKMYAPKIKERMGTVLGSNTILVKTQRYPLTSSPVDLALGSNLLVHNVGRAAAAVYAPATSSGIIYSNGSGIGGGSITVSNKVIGGADIVVNQVNTDFQVSRNGNGILLFSSTGIVLQEFDANSTGLDAASAAAAEDDQILLPVVVIEDDHTLADGVHYAGVSRRGSILTGQITGGAESSLERLSITRTANDTSKLCAVVSPISGDLYITDCELSATQSGAGTGYAISVQEGNVYIYNSRAYGSTSMTDEV